MLTFQLLQWREEEIDIVYYIVNRCVCSLIVKREKEKKMNQLRMVEEVSLESLDKEDRTWGRQTDEMKSHYQDRYS